MLDKLSATDFHPYLNQVFTLTFEDQERQLTLIEAEESREYEDDDRNPFSLIFEEDCAENLPQSTYTLNHPELAPLAIFIVPLGRKTGRRGEPLSGHQYQAVFN